MFGLRAVVSGKIEINGKEAAIRSPKDAIKNGIGLITEDRRGTGIFPLMSVLDNTSIASLGKYRSKLRLINHAEVKKDAEDVNKSLHTKTASMQNQIQNLSGGNQQKVILARWLMTAPDILIMDEPMRGRRSLELS